MKKIIFLLSLSNIFNQVFAQVNDCQSCHCFVNTSYSWRAYSSNKNIKDFLVRGDSLVFYNSRIKKMILKINKESLIKIKLLKIKNNVVFVKIINSEYFTQKIGSTGAMNFIAGLVYNLTEIKGVVKVYVDFIEGDHGGVPGLRSRKSFQELYNICK